MRLSVTTALLLGAMLLASTAAHAQYAWIDARGVRQYSDQPPPSDTPAAKILKAPHGMAAASAPPPAEAAAPAKGAPTLAEREADYRKRKALTQENDKKAITEKTNAEVKRANCDTAARNKAQLESGRPVRGADDSFLNEQGRARELADSIQTLKDCK